jgi:hypothetical protein
MRIVQIVIFALLSVGTHAFVPSINYCATTHLDSMVANQKCSKRVLTKQMCAVPQETLCATSITERGFWDRRNFLQASFLASALLAKTGPVFAASAGVDPKSTPERIESVQAPSPGVALDMLITMKMAKNLRELNSKVETEDWGAVASFLTSPWSSGTARFVRKNKVA